MRPSSKTHSWLSNPLDWSHIDRMILLATLILFSPVLVIAGVVAMYGLSPNELSDPVAKWLIIGELIYFLFLLALIYLASHKRKTQPQWLLMEYFLVYSYLITTSLITWLAGALFSAGPLMLLLGVTISAPLSSIRILKQAYFFTFFVFLIVVALTIQYSLPQAPLFTVSPYEADGSPRTFWLTFQIILVAVTLTFLFIALRATERWGNRERTYREMSTTDGLTHLTNRRALLERAEAEFRLAQQGNDSAFACIMVDIDHFKRINDTYGHQAGDAILVAVSSVLARNARQYDEVGRYGGEEFLVVLPGASEVQAALVAERLRNGIKQQQIPFNDKLISVTASFGVAAFPAPSINGFDKLLKAADDALYAAKNNGRNRVIRASQSYRLDQAD